MNKGLLLRIFVCIFFFGGCLYSYIDMQNEITKLRIRIPELTGALRRIEEENTRLYYEIEAFESPENLLRLAQNSAFTYMKYPTNQEVITMREADNLVERANSHLPQRKRSPNITFASHHP